MTGFIVVSAFILLVGPLAVLYGVDSRPTERDPRGWWPGRRRDSHAAGPTRARAARATSRTGDGAAQSDGRGHRSRPAASGPERGSIPSWSVLGRARARGPRSPHRSGLSGNPG
jgi:hypothetical protein